MKPRNETLKSLVLSTLLCSTILPLFAQDTPKPKPKAPNRRFPKSSPSWDSSSESRTTTRGT